MIRVLALACLLSISGPLCAELVQNGEHSFTTRHVADSAAPPETAWRVMSAHVDQWWNPEHSWSGQSSHLYMDLGHNGCFCERLPEGGHVEHLQIVYFAPSREIRFVGALGPLQSMPVQGRMTWTVEPIETGSRITFNYSVFGHPEGGLEAVAPAVDGVIGEQLQRLVARLAEY